MPSFWYDKDVRFDLMTRDLRLCSGEKIFECLEPVEDTKGNNGDPGRLAITNLRIIWQSRKYPKINLSIGYNPITTINIRSASSKLRGMTESLHILAKTRTSRYEFIFTNLILLDQNHLFQTVLAVHQSYSQTRLYREIKMRSGMIVTNKKLVMLPQEEICEQVNGVWNLSSDQGNLGSFYITNVRLVWFAATNELFNASIPFLQISQIRIRESKFGRALVIETCEEGGSYVLGFRVDPKEKLSSVCKTLLSLQEAYVKYPIYGVEFSTNDLDRDENDKKGGGEIWDEVKDGDEEGVSNPEMASDAYSLYYEESNGFGGGDESEEIQIEYCPSLGLAIEKPKDGFTIESLWEVIPPSSSSSLTAKT